MFLLLQQLFISSRTLYGAPQSPPSTPSPPPQQQQPEQQAGTNISAPTTRSAWRFFVICCLLTVLCFHEIRRMEFSQLLLLYDTISTGTSAFPPTDMTTTTDSLPQDDTQRRSESESLSASIKQDDEPPLRKQEPRVVMVTYVFGKAAAEKQYLRMFVESARFSGIDVLIVGDYTPPCLNENENNKNSLPSNVRHLLISWNELIDRVDRNVLQKFTNESSSSIASSLQALRQTTNYYKIIDYKPLFAVLFPEQVAAYDWWGHVDNDLILGNVRFFLSSTRTPRLGGGGNRNTEERLLHNFDIICANPNEYAWGPFTLYRNTPQVNELFRHAERPLVDIFANPDPQVFDEWGGGYSRDQGQHYTSTMAGIIEKYHEPLNLRWYGGIPAVWDGFCRGHKTDEGFCTECHLVRFGPNSDNNNNHHQDNPELPASPTPSTFIRQRLKQNCYGKLPCRQHVALCHFEFSKETMEESMSHSVSAAEGGGHDQDKNSDDFPILTYLSQTGRLRINFLEGFTALPSSSSSLSQPSLRRRQRQ